MQSAPFAVLQPGTTFHARYRVVRCIKAGGMGAVYEVVDEKTDSHRALKVMLPEVVDDPDHRARFALEAKVTGNVESDHLTRVSDAGIDEATGTPFLVMELLRGEELAQVMKKRRTLAPGEVVFYLWQAAMALDKTHAAGIVHRDLKPENLFVTYRDDGSPCVKIFDFGIAKIVKTGQAQKTRALGTPLYMAPEQVRGEGEVGPRADLYALAHIAYTALVGEAYWLEESKISDSLFPLLSKVISGATEPPSARARRRTGATLPPSFDAWFFSATAPRPENRYDRATTLITALAYATGVVSPTPSLSAATPFPAGGAPPSGAIGYAATATTGAPPSGPLPPASVSQPVPSSAAAPSVPSVPVPPAMETAARTTGVVVAPAAAPSRSALPIALGAIAVAALAALAFVVLRDARGSGTPAAPAVSVAPPAPSAAPSVAGAPSVTATASPLPATSTSAATPPAARPAGKVPAPDKAKPPKHGPDGIF